VRRNQFHLGGLVNLSRKKNVLILDDDEIRYDGLMEFARLMVGKHKPIVVSNEKDAIKLLASDIEWDLIMLDHDLGGEAYVISEKENTGGHLNTSKAVKANGRIFSTNDSNYSDLVSTEGSLEIGFNEGAQIGVIKSYDYVNNAYRALEINSLYVLLSSLIGTGTRIMKAAPDGGVIAATLNAIEVLNDSGVTGATVKDALNNLNTAIGNTVLTTGNQSKTGALEFDNTSSGGTQIIFKNYQNGGGATSNPLTARNYVAGGAAAFFGSNTGLATYFEATGAGTAIYVDVAGSGTTKGVVLNSNVGNTGDLLDAVSGKVVIKSTGELVSNTLNLGEFTVATLPTPTTTTAYATVTDALAPAYLVTVVGGGAVKCPVFFDGVSWKCH